MSNVKTYIKCLNYKCGKYFLKVEGIRVCPHCLKPIPK